MCCGTHVQVMVDIRERVLEDWVVAGEYEHDREFRRRMHRWLGDAWEDKDALIDAMPKQCSQPDV